MNRDYGKEIDGLHQQLEELKRLIMEFAKQPNEVKPAKPLERIEQMHNMHPDKRLSELMEELCEKTDESGSKGYVTYLGVYSSADRQSNWICNQVEADRLLELIESNAAAKVLTCINISDRLNILLALLRAPKTVAQLIEECEFNTTGQVYYHLRPLIAADLITEDKQIRGCYSLQPHRVQGVIMLLTGISDMLDTKYTQGNWDTPFDQ